MIGLEMTVKIDPKKRNEFIQVFEMSQTSDDSYLERISLQLFEKINETNTFLWQEKWQSAESLTLYYQDNRFRATMGAISILGELINFKQVIFEEEPTYG